MRYLKVWYFPLMCVIALGIYLCQLFDFELPLLINNYANDFLCLPIVLKICQFSVRLIKSNPQLTLPVSLQLAVTILFSIYFELVLPEYNNRYTGDLLDVVMYFTGLAFFLYAEQAPFFKKPLSAPYLKI